MYLFYSSSSGRIIGAKDHASVQLNVAEVSNIFNETAKAWRGLALFSRDQRQGGLEQGEVFYVEACYYFLRLMKKLVE